MEFCCDGLLSYTVPTNAAATRHVGLLSTGNVASAREEPNFSFYLILINLNLWAIFNLCTYHIGQYRLWTRTVKAWDLAGRREDSFTQGPGAEREDTGD